MSPLQIQICRGEILTPEKCEAYRANWRNNPLPQAKEAPPQREPCAHLGEEVRREQCEGCHGQVQLKVFACDVRGECTIQRPLAGVACCGGCMEWTHGTE
jgi:hypothetical protein